MTATVPKRAAEESSRARAGEHCPDTQEDQPHWPGTTVPTPTLLVAVAVFTEYRKQVTQSPTPPKYQPQPLELPSYTVHTMAPTHMADTATTIATAAATPQTQRLKTTTAMVVSQFTATPFFPCDNNSTYQRRSCKRPPHRRMRQTWRHQQSKPRQRPGTT